MTDKPIITKQGEFIYDKVFFPPNVSQFQHWRSEFLNLPNIEDYKLMFMGGTAEFLFGSSLIPSIDFDIFVSCPNPNYDSLYNILTEAIYLGLKIGLHIDIMFISKDCHTDFWPPFNIIRPYKILQSKVSDFPFKQVHKGLWEFDIFSENDTIRKFNKRLNNQHYSNLRYNLKTMERIYI